MIWEDQHEVGHLSNQLQEKASQKMGHLVKIIKMLKMHAVPFFDLKLSGIKLISMNYQFKIN